MAQHGKRHSHSKHIEPFCVWRIRLGSVIAYTTTKYVFSVFAVHNKDDIHICKAYTQFYSDCCPCMFISFFVLQFGIASSAQALKNILNEMSGAQNSVNYFFFILSTPFTRFFFITLSLSPPLSISFIARSNIYPVLYISMICKWNEIIRILSQRNGFRVTLDSNRSELIH